MSKTKERADEIVIDWRHLLMTLLKRSWVLVIAGTLFAVFAFIYSSFFVVPKYSSSVMLYVNNKSISFGEGKLDISAGDLSASQSLIDTYIVILNNRTTMEEIIEAAELDYTPGQVMGMISSSKMTGTEVFTVTVTCNDPYEAAHIANTIAEVLPGRIEDIIDGSSMRIVDDAVVNPTKVAPNITAQVIQAFIIGFILAAIVVAIIALLDDTIRNEDFLTDSFDIPVLARIPELQSSGKGAKYGKSGKYGYDHRYGHRSRYGYGHTHSHGEEGKK